MKPTTANEVGTQVRFRPVRGVVGLLRLAAVIVGEALATVVLLVALVPGFGDIFTVNVSIAAEVDLDQLALRSIGSTCSTTSRFERW